MVIVYMSVDDGQAQSALDNLDRALAHLRERQVEHMKEHGVTVWVHSFLADGRVMVVDGTDNKIFTIKGDQWPKVGALPNEKQRAALEAFETENATQPSEHEAG